MPGSLKRTGLKTNADGKMQGEGWHRAGIEGDRREAEEGCGKAKESGNGVLTYWVGMLILMSSLVATLQDREAEQTLFDN